MARLDVHPMPGGHPAYIVDAQADLLDYLATRTVLPLLPEGSVPKPIGELNPIVEIDGRRHVLLTQAIAAIPRRELRPAIASLATYRDSITRARDILLIGF
jgi:toxin CcdB